MAAGQSDQSKTVSTSQDGVSFGVIESRLGYLLHRTDLLHMELLRELLEPTGLTPARATAVAYIRKNSGAGQSDLARALGINRASAMEIVNHLVAIGAVERRAGRDKRSNALVLTAEGEALYARFDEISIGLDQIITASLSAPEVEQLALLLTKIRSSVEASISSGVPEV